MAHRARLTPWIPFYMETIDKQGRPLSEWYRKSASDEFSLKVSDNLYMKNEYKDSIWHKIIASELRDTVEYKYSDLAFYFAQGFLLFPLFSFSGPDKNVRKHHCSSST